MTVADWDLIIRDGAMVITSVIIPLAVLAYQRRTGVQVTDQQRAAVAATVETGAGLLRTMIDQGHISPAEVEPTHPAVVRLAIDAMARVPSAAAGQGTTLATIADKIVARVDTSKPAALVPA